MGCSPPSSWYEAQDRFYLEQKKKQHQARVNQMLNDISEMTPTEKCQLKDLLGLGQIPS